MNLQTGRTAAERPYVYERRFARTLYPRRGRGCCHPYVSACACAAHTMARCPSHPEWVYRVPGILRGVCAGYWLQ